MPSVNDATAAYAEFLDALDRVAAGHGARPRGVSQLLVRRRRNDPRKELTPREREVLALMADGRYNVNIGYLSG